MMKLKALLLLALCMVATNLSYAQQLQCGTTEKMQAMLAADPQFAAARQDLEEFTQRWVAEHAGNTERAVITIPVVVHVVYKTSAQNISDAQIRSQIEVLNEDYRAMNTDISGVPSVWTNRVADSEIQFELASRDPDGFLSNGITRTETTMNNWNGSDNVKYTAEGGKDAWPNTSYLNIWVCNIGSGLLGYAYQPGITPSLDGVVIGYNFFGRVGTLSGSYNKGRTTTHEVAHYLNLDHLWGAGGQNNNCTADDGVSDTPKQQGPNYGCNTTFPHETCGTNANSDMFNNYMDYGNDACLFFFTQGQKNRMLATLNGARATLKHSDALTPGELGVEDHLPASALVVYPNPTNGIISLRMDAGQSMHTDIRVMDLQGRTVHIRSNVNLRFTNTTLDLTELTAGTYVLELSSPAGRVTRRINIID